MMKYGVFHNGKAVYLLECRMDDPFLSTHPEYKTFYSFSDAINKFEKYSEIHKIRYYAARTPKSIVIASFLIPPTEKEIHGFNGPYDSVRIAYGAMRNEAKNALTNCCEFEDQFGIGARLVYDYFVDCDDKCFCRLRIISTATDINVCPLNSVEEMRSGQQVTLRLLGRTDEISVFSSPEKLQDEIHLPSTILIPIGTYYSDITQQTSSVVLTGMLSNVYLVSETNIRRYQATVHTQGIDVDLEIITHYTIHDYDFVYLTTNLSAYI